MTGKARFARHECKGLLRFLTCGGVDDGKSTLIGRLLHDSGRIHEDELAAVEAESARLGRPGGTGGGPDLALLVDGLRAERGEGVTIDVAHRYFATAKRKFIIADTPGHERYTRNMATGASNCDLAVILVDARRGVRAQTRRHSFIASLLGIRRIIVAVNKMDRVDFSQDAFERVRAGYLAFGAKLKDVEIGFIPLSAKFGDNVVHRSANMPWHAGKPLLAMLETIEAGQTGAGRGRAGFRFPVQYVNRPGPGFLGYCGTVASGAVRRGDAVVALPSGRESRVESIATFDGELERAPAGMAVTLMLGDGTGIGRGDLLAHPGSPPATGDRLDATVVWMAAAALLPGARHEIKIGARAVMGTVESVRNRIDVATLSERPAARLGLNEIGRVEIALDGPAAFDNYRDNRATGGFILIDPRSNETVGAGMIHRQESSD